MKLPQVSMTQRLLFANLLLVLILSIAIFTVIRSLYYVESTLKTEASEHVSVLTINSEISRRVFALTSRVKLLEQTILFSDTMLSEEASSIDLQLQRLRELSTNRDFSEKMDSFIDNFHRFLGSSFALNRILKQTQETDRTLAIQLDNLEFMIADHKLENMRELHSLRYSNELDLANMLREAFLTVGKMVGSIHTRITPETEKVLIIAIQKELDIFLLHLENIDIDSEEAKVHKKRMQRTVGRYNAAMRRISANLDQRWVVVSSLVNAQNELIDMVEKTETRVQRQALQLTEDLKREIGQSRFNAIVISIIAFLVSLFLISQVVKRHIRKPLDDLKEGFEKLESQGENKPINLGRTDEWSHIENAFNKMAERLSEAYFELNEEKKNFDFLAHHDPLTGLANRLLATKRLSEEIAKANDDGTSFALLYLDIDEFKTINDSLGHASGDNLLASIAEILKQLISDIGFVARMGGDEFMVVLSNVDGISSAVMLAERINRALRKPYYIHDKTVFVSASIGVCQFPNHGKDGDTLIRNADTAMYQAKRNGRDQYRIYADKMTLEINDLIETNIGLHQAIKNNELVVFFQPKIDLNTKKIVGAEALVRWRHPKMGLLLPAEFLEVAEKTDLIIDIDKWVFREVANLISEWQTAGVDLSGVIVSVNFSARMFYMTDLADQLQKILDDTLCKPNQLLLEITERDMMSDFETCVRTIESLRSKGYKIAIDDFGTGYSSLSVLQYLSADCIKLDRGFIQGVNASKLDYEITNAVLKMAQVLDLVVIAEGVESKSQVDTLLKIGCRLAQGNYFAEPLPVDDWVDYLNGGRHKERDVHK